MRKKSLLYHFTLGLLIGALIMPGQPVHAQFGFGVVFDPKAYALQIEKRLEEARRHVQTFDNAVKQFTTLKGVLEKADELVAKNRNTIKTMANIGRTVRATLQLKDQAEAIIKTRLTMLKSIDDRLRDGIFNPEADLRDFEDYLRSSIGRSSQDTLANSQRLRDMDNMLERWRNEKDKLQEKLRDANRKKKAMEGLLETEEGKTEGGAGETMASLRAELSALNELIEQYEAKLEELDCQILKREMQYNVMMDERVKFGEQVKTTNQAWSEFNDALDEIERTLSKY